MRVMLDTNILISAIFFPSEVTRNFIKHIGINHRIVLCDYVIDELRIVVDRKFPNKKRILEDFFNELPFELIHMHKNLNLEEFPRVRDIKDAPILAIAIIKNVDVIVTGDKDLLVIDIERPEIINMSEFVTKY